MEGSSKREFLTGLLAGWFATGRGREKPNAKDKKDAAAVAASTVDRFDYIQQFSSK